ncbi:MAG: type II CRISPR RNA-guided endonuclease Cas9 [Tissierellia bacterium]|nr:type II CRISPR RNA-guided endonuclease Cas9 [Tissierellia bacterium]
MKKEFGKYYLGLDVGTNSVGWAVTDENYKILKFNNKSMWGVHLFEEGKTAEERRMVRCSRRMVARRKDRISLLSDLFFDEIQKVDKDFFERLKDSEFWAEDKSINQKNTLFYDKGFTDKDFHQKYPTIYHLRSDLIHSEKPHDIRLVYLALHHIVKHRGHFLYEGQDFNTFSNFESVFSDTLNTLTDYGIDFGILSSDEIKDVLKNKDMRVSEKKKKIKDLMCADTTEKKAVADLISGSKVALSAIFGNKDFEDEDISKISFSEGIDEGKLTDILQDKMYLIQKLKSLYDWSVLTNILQDKTYISDAKKEIFDNHKHDIKILKNFLKRNKAFSEYKEIFKYETEDSNYNAYIGRSDNKLCGQKEFCSYVLKKIKEIKPQDSDEKELIQRLEDYKAFPKQVSKDNGVIPHQLHLYELEKILENAQKYLKFLNIKDKEGLTPVQKIKSIFIFRIPYYVGPLNPHSQFSWIVKKQEKKIYPWNFDDVVDKETSAEKFILRMTNKCTYLKGKDVLPKESILYSKFNLLNQLNNIRINGEKLPINVKHTLYKDLFLNVDKPKRITIKALKNYFISKGMFENQNFDVTGIDLEIIGNLKPLIDFKEIMEESKLSEVEIDKIIQRIVIIGETKTLLKQYLDREYGEVLDEKDISHILKLKYSGWGRFSKEFLTDIYHIDKKTKKNKNILTMLWETDCNLMQLLSNEYDFMNNISLLNSQNGTNSDRIQYSLLQDLYVSPAVKRSIWRTLLISKEINKIMGHEPEKIFIEMARGSDSINLKGKRTTSRKERLSQLLENSKEYEAQLLEELNREDEGNLRDNRLYLYYTQLGKCMYSNEKINLNDLYSLYDIDHIYPQSRVKDDSIHSNMVLVKKCLNSKKGNEYPIPKDIISEGAREHWSTLLKKELITKEKYNRLMRKTPFSDNELSGFIARQLVETRQSTKAIANILKEIFTKSEIVYVKSENVSDFRHKYEITKSRLVNDFHHAKDAYLNIVVGNVYHEKFTSNPLNFIKRGHEYSLNKVFDFTVKKGSRIVWDSKNSCSLNNVKKQVAKNNILFTKYAFTRKGEFFKQQPLKAGQGQFPLKISDQRLLQIKKYGAYDKVGGAYFFLLEHKENKKTKKSFSFVPINLANSIKTKNDLINYCENTLKLSEVRIILPKIKINTLFEVNGFRMHLSGRTGKRIVFKGAMPLVFSDYLYTYAKKIEKYIERNRQKNKIFPITEHQKITSDENLIIYDEFINKLKNTIYNTKLSAQLEVFEKGRDIFISLDLPKQCELIYNAFNLFGTTPALTDLSLIKGARDSGRLSNSSNLSRSDKILIINQSITGIFEKKWDLNKL